MSLSGTALRTKKLLSRLKICQQTLSLENLSSHTKQSFIMSRNLPVQAHTLRYKEIEFAQSFHVGGGLVG